MKKASSFQDLIVWQHAHKLVLNTYKLTESFPRSEMFCLTAQMRRAAISVPANIAEGFRKRGVPDKLRILNIAQGSLEELRYYFILAQDLGYASTETIESKLADVSRLIIGYAGGMASKARSRRIPSP
jgi:four helix bundle protein